MTPRVLVTGATGFLGRHLLQALAAQRGNGRSITGAPETSVTIAKNSRSVVAVPGRWYTARGWGSSVMRASAVATSRTSVKCMPPDGTSGTLPSSTFCT